MVVIRTLGKALRQIGFNTKQDRLFSLGDIIDRSPESHKALVLIAQPWCSVLRGNHESMILDLYADGQPHEAAVEFMTSRNGMAWWREVSETDRQALVTAFRKLPIVIELRHSAVRSASSMAKSLWEWIGRPSPPLSSAATRK
jgi:serine/threonine protein phosphatase 1